MESNVGSVDLEELKKAREELDREKGVEHDPNMYSNYNPNREESTESLPASEEVLPASEPVVDEDSSSYESALLDELVANDLAETQTLAAESSAVPETSSASVQNELLDENPLDVGDLIDALTTDILGEDSAEPVSSAESVTTSSDSADDLSIYDSFAAFEVGGASAPETATVQETPVVEIEPVAEPVPEIETAKLVEEVKPEVEESANIPDLSAFEINVDSGAVAEEPEMPNNEDDSINPATTSGLLSIDDFDIGGEEKPEEPDVPQTESVETADEESFEIPGLDDFKITDESEVDPMESVDTVAEPLIDDEISHEDTFEISQEEPSNSIEAIEDASKLLDGTFEGDEQVAPESSSEELTNINLHNEEIKDNNAASKVDDGMQIVGSYKQLEDLLNEDEEAQELLKQMEEVSEEAEAQEQNIQEATVSKFKQIESFKYVDLISTDNFKNSDKLSYILGKDENDEIVYGNLRDSYNIAIFGKETVELNNLVHSILLSLIMKNSVSDINFIMCDSKADSKFEVYNKSSYMYFNRIAKTNKEILDTLIEVSKELEERYNLLAETGVKSIEQYNVIAKNDNLKPLPYLLTVFNNYSKAIQLTNSDKINACLHQILKFGRIVGLYLIVVANAPIISDEINYNLPTRISFKQEDANRSLTTLGFAGAEHLQTAEDVLLLTLENETVTHLKSPILTKAEIELLIENIEE